MHRNAISVSGITNLYFVLTHTEIKECVCHNPFPQSPKFEALTAVLLRSRLLERHVVSVDDWLLTFRMIVMPSLANVKQPDIAILHSFTAVRMALVS